MSATRNLFQKIARIHKSNKIFLACAFASVLFLAALIPAAQHSMLQQQAFAQEAPELQQVTVSGILHTIWSSLGPGLEGDHPVEPTYLLTNETNLQTFQLLIDEGVAQEAGGALRLNNHDVVATGILDPETNIIEVEAIRLDEQIPPIGSHLMGSHVSGPQKWVTIMCRFGDSPGVTPEPPSFFNDLMDYMDIYWQELSYNNINLAGSIVVGWYDLPNPRADYLDDPATHFAGHTLDFVQISQDCANAADADVNFPDFAGINFVFNEDLDCCSWGGGIDLNNDGMLKGYSATWMATWGWGNQDVMGQEMGHGFGLPHSSGPYTATYDSQWDVMSGGGTCSDPHPNFGCEGVHTISFHKDALGWIDASRRYEATTDPDQLIFVERLANPNPVGYLTAWVPIGGSMTDYYFIESRKFVGFDNEIPAEGVLIHKVDTTLSDRLAQVVDGSPAGNPNDAGAIWTVGELYQDNVNNISIGVVEETESGFWVIINPTVADVSVLKSDSPDPVAAGTQLTYTIDVANAGPDSAENVVVVDTLPSEVSYVSDNGGCVEAPMGTLTCNLGTMLPGDPDSFTITVDVAADAASSGGGTTFISNTVHVSSDQFDTDMNDNQRTIFTQIVSEADLEIVSFDITNTTPGEVLIGDTFTVNMTKVITNNGPSSPVDVDVDVVALYNASVVTVTPTSDNQQVTELEDGELEEVMESFDITCDAPGVHEVTFMNTIAPAYGTDPDLSNNQANVTADVECVISVQINIHPGSYPNSANLKSKQGVIPVAILTTEAGEYGLPFAIDATMIDPLSVHFGPMDALFDIDPPGGATEFHGAGHIEDSYELDEVTKDGDSDMLLHFRAPETGLDSLDTEACVKGQIDIGGTWYTFFGCDSITPVPLDK